MYIGTSVFLIALGAILKYAVTATVAGVDIQTAGLILLLVGLAGLVLSVFLEVLHRDRRREVVVEEQPVVRERLR